MWSNDKRNNNFIFFINRGSYMSSHVLLNLSNELRKIEKMRGLPRIYHCFATSLINLIIQEHKC